MSHDHFTEATSPSETQSLPSLGERKHSISDILSADTVSDAALILNFANSSEKKVTKRKQPSLPSLKEVLSSISYMEPNKVQTSPPKTSLRVPETKPYQRSPPGYQPVLPIMRPNQKKDLKILKVEYFSQLPKAHYYSQLPHHRVPQAQNYDPDDEQRNLYCPYPQCGKLFNSKSHLKRHQKTHQKEKPFKCVLNECEKYFTRHDNMMHHYRTQHKEIYLKETELNKA